MSLTALFRTLVLITLLGLSIAVYTGLQINQLQSQQQNLAAQRQSTVDRLRLVRAEIQAARQLVAKYVVNNDSRSLVTYYELLDMHAGNRRYATPVGAEAWGEFLAGNPISSIQLIEEPGPTIDQRLEVTLAGAETSPETISQFTRTLFSREQIIFALTQGLYDPDTNQFVSEAKRRPDLALQRLYSPDYQQLVNNAASVIDRQINRTDKGYQNQLESLSKQISSFAQLSLYALLFLAALLIAGLVTILRFVIGPIRELDTLSREVEAGRYETPVPQASFVKEMINLTHGIKLMLGAFTRELKEREDKIAAERQALEAQIAREKAEADVAARGALLANMSHEIRTPMNAIIGMTNLVLRSGELTGKSRNQLDKALSAARSLLGLLNDILDFSKAESGMVELEQIPFKLDDVLSHAFLAVQTEADKKQLLLLNRLSGDNAYALSQHLVGDPLRMRQIFTNLLGNAVKFTEKGQINVHTSIKKNSNTSVALTIEVSDSGIGMTAEQAQRVFDKYRQASSSTSRQHGGTGLGLNITKELVKLMDGTITVNSSPGEGSIFTITLPMAIDSDNLAVHAQKSLFERCLVIGKYTSVQYALQTSLAATGTKVDFVATDAASEQLEAAEMDLEAIIITEPDQLFKLPELCQAIEHWADNYLGKVIVILNSPDKYHDAEAVKAFSNLLPEDTVFVPNPVLLEDLANLGSEVPSQQDPLTEVENYLSGYRHQLQGRHILVLEDHPVNQVLIAEQLQSVGIDVTLAQDGLEGLAKLQGHDHGFDLVISDIEMPNLDGLGFTEAARSLAHLKTLPIVGLTGHAFTEVIQRCHQAGMNHVLTKPLEERDLYALLANLLGGRPAPSVSAPQENRSPSLNRQHLIDIFLKHCTQAPSKLRSLLEAQKQSDFAREIHSLVGALAVIEENDLSGQMRIMERGIKAGDLSIDMVMEEVDRLWPPLLTKLTMLDRATPRR